MDFAFDRKMFLDQSTFIPSFDCELREDPILFFYHLGKTGGTTVGSFLNVLALALSKPIGQFLDKRGRALMPPPPEHLSPIPWILTGHAIYGYHQFYDTEMSLMTVIRDPVDRILSEYFWKHRSEHKDILADRSHFSAFLNDQARQNFLTTCLLGSDLDHGDPAKLAIERLKGFKYVATTAGINTMLSVVASVNGAPSVWLKNAKVSPFNSIKVRLREEFASVIKTRNESDALLFEFAQNRQIELDEEYRRLAAFPQREGQYATMILRFDKEVISKGKDTVIYDLANDQVLLGQIHNWCSMPLVLGTLGDGMTININKPK